MSIIEFSIPYPPSANRIWRQGHGRVHKSKEYQDWLALSAWEIRAQIGPKQVITEPFKLELRVNRPDKRKRDLDNLLKPVLDLIGHYGLIENDSLCHWIDARWKGKGAYCYIKLEELKDGEAQ
jgi:crossover junction endodeoxyribonuclease RusA